MASSLLDDLARRLAEPMPRSRAVRVVGATLVAAAVPGLRPRPALARSRANCDLGCGPDNRACPRIVQGAPGQPECCGAPARRYGCEGTWFEPVCVDKCGGPEDDPCPGKKDQDGCSLFQCCKGPSKCMNGGCSESCTIETGFNTGKTVQYDPKTQCCTAFGPRDKKTGSARECGDARKPRPGYKPTANGCGSKDTDVPDEFTFTVKIGKKTRKGTVSFTKACNAHDRCYGTCQAGKEKCDDAFRDAMRGACNQAFRGSGKFTKRLRAECFDMAATYRFGVSFADSEYWAAQTEACLCC